MTKLIKILKEERNNLLMLIFVVVIFVLFLCYVWRNPYVNHIPFGVLDKDNSALSNTIISSLAANEGLNVCYYAGSESELELAIRDKKVNAGIIIPEDYAVNISRKLSPQILVVSDGTNINLGGNAVAAASSVLSTINAGLTVKMLEGNGMAPAEAQTALGTFSYVERILYEPQGGNIPRNMYTIVLLITMQIFIRFIVPAMVNRREMFAMAEKKEHPALVLDFAVRIAIYIATSVVVNFFALCLAGKLYALPLRGEIWIFTVSTLAFMLNVTAFGLVCGAITKNTAHFFQVNAMFTLTFMFTSGIVYPYHMMPGFLVTIIKLLSPFAAMSVGLKAVNLKGIGWDAAQPYIIDSLFYTSFWIILGALLYARSIRLLKEKRQTINTLARGL